MNEKRGGGGRDAQSPRELQREGERKRGTAVTPTTARRHRTQAGARTPADTDTGSTEARAQARGRPMSARHTHTKAAGLSREGDHTRRTTERPGPPRPRPALTSAPHAGLRGVMAGSPLPPLGLGVAGRAPGRGRRTRRRTRAHARTHGRAARRRPRRPGAREGRREPGGGGEPPSGREATEGGDGPEAEVAARPALRYCRRPRPQRACAAAAFAAPPALTAASLPARGQGGQAPPGGPERHARTSAGLGEAGRQARPRKAGKGPRRRQPARPLRPQHPAALWRCTSSQGGENCRQSPPPQAGLAPQPPCSHAPRRRRAGGHAGGVCPVGRAKGAEAGGQSQQGSGGPEWGRGVYTHRTQSSSVK